MVVACIRPGTASAGRRSPGSSRRKSGRQRKARSRHPPGGPQSSGWRGGDGFIIRARQAVANHRFAIRVCRPALMHPRHMGMMNYSFPVHRGAYNGPTRAAPAAVNIQTEHSGEQQHMASGIAKRLVAAALAIGALGIMHTAGAADPDKKNPLRRHRRPVLGPDPLRHQAHHGKAGLQGHHRRVQRLRAAERRWPTAPSTPMPSARGLPEEVLRRPQAAALRRGRYRPRRSASTAASTSRWAR